MKKYIFLLILFFIFYMPVLIFAVENDVKQFENINLLGVRTGASSDEIVSILKEKYDRNKFGFKYDISGATGERYVEKIEAGTKDDLKHTNDKWQILFTDQTIGGSAAFINRHVVPEVMVSTKNIIKDLTNKFGLPTIFNNQVESRKIIRIRWHYASTGELMDSLPSKYFIKVDQISGGKQIDLLPKKECVEVYTDALRGKIFCEGKDVAVEIATNNDGELLKSLSISIRDYDLENSDLIKDKRETLRTNEAFLNKAKEGASDKNISF